MKIKRIIIVGLFASAGGMLRYLVNECWGSGGILTPNLLGSFLLAFLTYITIERGMVADWLSLGLGTGLFGALTTFSTFTVTTITWWQTRPWQAGLYFTVSSGGGLLMAGLGVWLAHYLRRP